MSPFETTDRSRPAEDESFRQRAAGAPLVSGEARRTMRIDIRPSQAWSPASVALVRTRLEFALGRFAGRVRSLTVRLTDTNGPRGGCDKKCLIAVRLTSPHHLIVIEDVDVDRNVVVSRAAARASRAVSRAVRFARDYRTVPAGF